MDSEAQAIAYARADFNETDAMFVDRFTAQFGSAIEGAVLDLGCGPGNIAFRFARRHPQVHVDAVDGAAAMLAQGARILEQSLDIRDRVELTEGFIPDVTMPRPQYDVVVSNSLLHHLPDPSVLWLTILRYARPGAPVQVMDLRRPGDATAARGLRVRHMGAAPEVLQADFYNSLRAAFEPDEIRQQLDHAGVGEWIVEVVGDRHVMVSGVAPHAPA
jgi:2-polyprenyl-3-methyl-5-hydroxy-6-metoxy-1,4-benzoquinol methylase